MVILGQAFIYLSIYFTNGISIRNDISHDTYWYTKLVDWPISQSGLDQLQPRVMSPPSWASVVN